MKETTIAQEYIIRCPDGILKGAAVTMQNCLVDGDGKVLYRLGMVIIDLSEEQKQSLAELLGLQYEPPQPIISP